MGPKSRPHRSGFQDDVLLSALDDDLTSSVVTALWAYAMIDHAGATVRASSNCWDRSEVVCTTLVSALL